MSLRETQWKHVYIVTRFLEIARLGQDIWLCVVRSQGSAIVLEPAIVNHLLQVQQKNPGNISLKSISLYISYKIYILILLNIHRPISSSLPTPAPMMDNEADASSISLPNNEESLLKCLHCNWKCKSKTWLTRHMNKTHPNL